MCAQLVATSVSFSYGPNSIVLDASFTIGAGDRLGLVGRNGAGKSTLLGLLSGELVPDSGTINPVPANASVSLYRQVVEHGRELGVFAWLAWRAGVDAIETEFSAATAGLAGGGADAEQRYDRALTQLSNADLATFDERAIIALANVDLSALDPHQPVATLSGGQRTRLQLASLQLLTTDILLLDEPTNDLDAGGLDYLETTLLARREPTVVVSHDRAFLSAFVTGILELDDHDRTITRYDGGFDAWVEQRATARRHAEDAWQNWSSTRSELKDRAATQRQWAEKGVARHKRSNEPDRNLRMAKIARAEKGAGGASRAERALARHDRARIDKPWEGWELQLDFATVPTAGSEVARADALVVSRPGFILGPIDLVISSGDRVLLTGPNGGGKTTLLDALFGVLEGTGGSARQGPGTVVGQMTQGRTVFGDAELLDAFVELSDLDHAGARSQLAKLGLGAEHISRPADQLSPGEQTRAILGLFAARGVNTMVLDEPTNHLDLEAIEQLEAALDRFEGTVVLVTHDREMAQRFSANRTIHVSGGAVVEG